MEDIARRSGLGRATVYRRFPTKAALIDALVLASYGPGCQRPALPPAVQPFQHALPPAVQPFQHHPGTLPTQHR
ncbi:helix-turn-helix transcriptional regulator, partial [Mycobacterium riyadhense]|nr:helix-turn-helix transcriptional regulator [Mycobacterium riyadhense]